MSLAVNEDTDIDQNLAKSILKMDSRARSQKDLAVLQVYFKKNAFIAQESQKLNNDKETLQLLYKSLQLDEIPKGKEVFSYGDSGNTFYIILSGEVEIKIPASFDLEGLDCTAEAVLSFMVTFLEDVQWS